MSASDNSVMYPCPGCRRQVDTDEYGSICPDCRSGLWGMDGERLMASIPMRDLARFLMLVGCVWDKEPGTVTKAKELLSRYGMDLTRFTDDQQANRWQPLVEALRRAQVFIEYARYELQPGKATIGDQFPRQEDADIVLARIKAALAHAPEKEKDE